MKDYSDPVIAILYQTNIIYLFDCLAHTRLGRPGRPGFFSPLAA